MTDYLLAFFAGFLLNFMPCVLPAVAVKLHAIVTNSLKFAGFLYALTCVVVFSVIGYVLLYIPGAILGWGSQMGNPTFLLSMAAVFYILGMSAMNWLYVPHQLDRLAAKTRITGYGTALLSGLLAPLVGAACIAPFIGVSLGAAYMMGGAAGVAVFGTIGLGMASPFIALEFFPKLVKRIPRQGKWNIVLKRIIGVGMLATSAWFLYVLHSVLEATK